MSRLNGNSRSTAVTALGYRHPRVQRLRRLCSKRSFRSEERAFVIEGAKVLEVALSSGAGVEAIYYSAEGLDTADVALLERCQEAGIGAFELEAGVLARAADTVTPQPLAAVVSMVCLDLEIIDPGARRPVVVCAEVRDPGNAGTILRSAEASGAQAVVFTGGSVDVFNPKTVRASAGTLFQLPVLNGADLQTTLASLASKGFVTVGTVPRAGVAYDQTDLSGNVAFVLGNEAHGLDPDTLALLDLGVSIPMVGNAESLNVGIASAVLCFESLRQRRAKDLPTLSPSGDSLSSVSQI